MGGHNCAVSGCSNSTARIYKWRSEPCTIHEKQTRKECGCWLDPPYKLYCFPSSLRNGDKRKRWIAALRRINKGKSEWKPCNSDRVCSKHFVDGEPTNAKPDPTLHMGYDLPQKKSRRELFRHPVPPRVKNQKPETLNKEQQEQPMEVDMEDSFLSPPPPSSSHHSSSVFFDHSYVSSTPHSISCLKCNDKSTLIDSLVNKVNKLSLQIKKAKREKLLHSSFTWRKIKTDAKINFYTGISSISLFNVLFTLLSAYLPKLRYWRGTKRNIRFSKVKRTMLTTPKTKKLSHRDEFLLTLMRLRLALLNEDLADRFGISPAICSNTFTTWIRLMSRILGDALVVWLLRESIRDNLPEVFIKSGHVKCHVIIDCAEVFIEQPKSLTNQAATWSDYKHHNTMKFLVGITPSGFISFLSDCYGGRASDKFITADSGLYDLLERDDEVMADRGFQIREELMLRFCSLSVPPGARAKSQMTMSECRKTKDVANLRIHVERAINRIKLYRILKNTLPITMLHHVDDIVKTCAALCNLKPLLINSK